MFLKPEIKYWQIVPYDTCMLSNCNDDAEVMLGNIFSLWTWPMTLTLGIPEFWVWHIVFLWWRLVAIIIRDNLIGLVMWKLRSWNQCPSDLGHKQSWIIICNVSSCHNQQLCQEVIWIIVWYAVENIFSIQTWIILTGVFSPFWEQDRPDPQNW